MPGNKRWYLELRGGTILVFRDGNEITAKNVPLGPVKEVFYGAENAKASTFKLHALEVSRVYNYKLASVIYHAMFMPLMGLYR